MLFVLCGLADTAGLWFAQWARAAGADCAVLTTEALSFARRRSHRLGASGVSAALEVPGLAELASGQATGVLNRLTEPPAAAWRAASPSERHYATAELHAFILSALHSLPDPVRNRPTPVCLAGPSPHPFVAAVSARRAGLASAPLRVSTTAAGSAAEVVLTAAAQAAGPAARLRHLLCLDGALLDPEGVPASVAAGARRLAGAIGAEQALIGLDFLVGPNGWWFAGLSPLPDLRAGGPAGRERLLELLATGAPAGRRTAVAGRGSMAGRGSVAGR